MLKNITIGQYIPGDSFIHRLDPRTKINISLFYMIYLFFIDKFTSFIPIYCYIFFVIYVCKIPFKLILKGIKNLTIIISITVIFNVFLIPGETLFEIFGFRATVEGAKFAAFMVIRIIALVMGTSLLTLTTSPIQLTDGIEKLLKPFEKIKLPAHEISMMMTIALRFIPTLVEETDKIMKAQKARGANFEEGNIFKRAKALVPILIPLFISSFRRANDLATAMEARLYRGGKGRSKFKIMQYTRLDFVTYISVFLFFLAIYSLNYMDFIV